MRKLLLGSFAQMKYGKMPDKTKLMDVGYPVFSGYRIVGYTNEYHFEEPQLIVVARGVGGTGDVKLSPPKAYITNLSISVVVDPAIADKEYLYYYFKVNNLRYLDSGSAQSQITIGDLRRLEVELPDIEKQKLIAKSLRLLDSKIELNERVNLSLETMAKSIFKEWFCDFGPVKAKAEGKAPFGMDNDTASLFPNSFDDSEIGMIPKGWKIAPLKEITSYISRGVSPKYVEVEGIRVYNQKCVRNGIILDKPSRLHDAKARSVEGRLLEHLDILVNSTGTGTLGRVGQIWKPERSIVDSHVTIVRADPATYSAILLGVYCRIREREIEGLGEGSTGQTELSKIRLSELKFIVPPFEVQSKADAIIGPMMEQKYSNLAEIQTLINMRDLLLPKLISGELQLSEVTIE